MANVTKTGSRSETIAAGNGSARNLRRRAFRWMRVLAVIGVMTAVAAVQGCAQRPSITENDVSEVLTKAVLAAAEKLPKDFCLNPNLAPSSTIWPDKPDSEGWAASANNPGLKYRRLPSPRLARMPQPALQAFQKPVAGRDCRHTLVFNEPDFVEARSSNETFIETAIWFNDPCPTCGAGYTVEFTKNPGQAWKMHSQGVTIVAVS